MPYSLGMVWVPATVEALVNVRSSAKPREVAVRIALHSAARRNVADDVVHSERKVADWRTCYLDDAYLSDASQIRQSAHRKLRNFVCILSYTKHSIVKYKPKLRNLGM